MATGSVAGEGVAGGRTEDADKVGSMNGAMAYLDVYNK